MPKVSIVIPTHNRACLITEAVQSTIDQPFTDFELIIVDDGSTDNTKDVVSSFRDPRINYIFQKNQGVCKARNTGINASSGEYITFLDSDDKLLRNALVKGVEILDEFPTVALCYGQHYFMYESGQMSGLKKPPNRPPGILQGIKEISNFLVCGNYISPSSTVVRKSSVIKVGSFDFTFFAGSEDFDLWVRLAKNSAIAYIAEPFCIIRISTISITASRKLDEIELSHKRIIQGIYNDTELGISLLCPQSKSYFHMYLQLAYLYHEKGKMKMAMKCLFKALKVYPKALRGQLALTWLYQLSNTCLPFPILRSLKGIKRHFWERAKLLEIHVM